MEQIHCLRIATHQNVLSACNTILPIYRTCEALGVSMSELLDGLDEKPRMAVVRKDERWPLELDRPGSRVVLHRSSSHSRHAADSRAYLPRIHLYRQQI